MQGREDTGRKGWGMEVELALGRRHLASSPQTGSRKRDKRADKGPGGREGAQEVSRVPVWWLLFAQVGTKESWAPAMVDLPQQEEYYRENCMHA